MKKLFAVLIMLAMLCSCTGLNPSVIVNTGTDVAFALVLQNNPAYKPAIVVGLNQVKTVLSGSITYDDLLVQITKAFPDQYALVATIIIGDLNADQPVLTTTIPLLDSYKTAVTAEIDHLILLTSIVK